MTIRSVAVLGAGTMGAQIALHCANAGIPSLLLDLTADAARAGPREGAQAQARSAVHARRAAGSSRTGGFDTTCDLIADGRLDHRGRRRAARHQAAAARARRREARGPASIVSSNTSGIPIARARRRPLATTSAGTGSARTSSIRRATCGCSRSFPTRRDRSGGGRGDDALRRSRARQGRGASPRTRRTSSATTSRCTAWRARSTRWRAGRVHDRRDRRDHRAGARPAGQRDVPDDGHRRHRRARARDAQPRASGCRARPTARRSRVPPLVEQLIARGALGEKTGKGFYERRKNAARRVRDLDARSRRRCEYRPKQSARIASIEAGAVDRRPRRARADAVQRARTRPASSCARRWRRRWSTPRASTPDIAHSIDDVDRVMRWGFGWDLGPFELFDAIGVKRGARPPREGTQAMRPAACRRSIARPARRRAATASAKALVTPAAPDLQILRDARRSTSRVVKKNAGASLVDLGDGVLAVEFHSKMNAIGGDTIADAAGRRARKPRRTARRWSSATTRRTSPPAPT